MDVMRLYRLLLRLYPAWFRAEYGEEMCAIFALRREREGAAALWASVLAEVLTNSIAVQTDSLRQDFRWTWRVLRKSPGFTATTIVVIALGIGANTAAFTLLNYVLLRPLPFVQAERLVMLHEVRLKQGSERNLTSPPNFLEWRAMSKSFEAMGAYLAAPISVNVSGRNDPVRLDSALMSTDVFKILQTQPAAGRVFSSEDDRIDGPNIVLMSYSIALALFGSAQAAVNESVSLDNVPHTIVGVMPPGFAFPSRDFQLWRPLRFVPALLANRSNHILFGLARLRPDVSVAEARAEMALIAAMLASAYPKDNADTGIGVMKLRDAISPQSRTIVIAIFAASFCLLLIACTNLANLLFARSIARRQEIAVRVAIGAARERLVRQLLTESLTVAIIGGALGLALSIVATPWLSVLVPAALPISARPEVDWRIFLFAAALTIATSLAFGVGPAYRSSRSIDANALRARSGRVRTDRLRAVLVLAEIAGTFILLVGAGLLMKALWHVQAIDPGFRVEGVLSLRTALPSPKYNPPAARRTFYSRVLNQVRALPGVRSAAYVSYQPMEPFSGRTAVTVPGVVEDLLTAPRAIRHFVTPGFFATLDIPLRRGRDFANGDMENTPMVAIISESLAERLWPGQDPIGRTLVADGRRTVVGVAGEIAVQRLEGAGSPQIYFPAEQMTLPSYYWPKDLLIYTAGDPAALGPAVRTAIHEADPEQAVSNLQPLADIIDAQSAPRRAQLYVVGAFTALGFVLAAIGIHGLLSFGVSARTQEIGVRMALGAARRDILVIFLRQGIILAVFGILLAVPLAYAAARMLTSLLFGVQPGDPSAYVGAALIAVVMTIAGSLRPALRAANIDLISSIRSE